MLEPQAHPHNTDPTSIHADMRATLAAVKSDMASYDPDGRMGIPSVEGTQRGFTEMISGSETVPADILLGYAASLQFHEDALAHYSKREPDYWSKLRDISGLDAVNLKTLYEADENANPLLSMLTYQVSNEGGGKVFIDDALKIVKKVYDVETTPELTHTSPNDPVIIALKHALRSGDADISRFFAADTANGKTVPQGSQERRAWMRDALQMATDITNPDQADAYIYANSRSAWGDYSLKTLVERINSYGSDKLAAIKEFANISALSSYSDKQLERVYKLSQGDKDEVARLKEHDVIVTLINMDGDHNGVSEEVAERLDDEGERNLFFEITKPEQVYQHLKKLHDLGIKPSTLIFASHGTAGQYDISERPALDSEDQNHHVTAVIEQALLDKITADNPYLEGYDVANANGLIRSVERFMQPSRALDDPDKDLGRKKIISLSCKFDGEVPRVTAGPDGEIVKGANTSLLRRLGEVIIDKLANEHLDIYGADISTNSQTKTPRGFHYNQIQDGRHVLYPASVVHIDGKQTKLSRSDEVQLRKS